MRARPLALPPGELSPQVTERGACGFWGKLVCPLRPRCARPPLPKGEARNARTGHRPLARPPGERSPQVTERVLRLLVWSLFCPLRPRFAQPPLPKGEARGELLCSATSPKGRGRGCPHGAPPLGAPSGRAVTAGDGEGVQFFVKKGTDGPVLSSHRMKFVQLPRSAWGGSMPAARPASMHLRSQARFRARLRMVWRPSASSAASPGVLPWTTFQ